MAILGGMETISGGSNNWPNVWKNENMKSQKSQYVVGLKLKRKPKQSYKYEGDIGSAVRDRDFPSLGGVASGIGSWNINSSNTWEHFWNQKKTVSQSSQSILDFQTQFEKSYNQDFQQKMAEMNLRGSVWVDNTASAQVAQQYTTALTTPTLTIARK